MPELLPNQMTKILQLSLRLSPSDNACIVALFEVSHLHCLAWWSAEGSTKTGLAVHDVHAFSVYHSFRMLRDSHPISIMSTTSRIYDLELYCHHRQRNYCQDCLLVTCECSNPPTALSKPAGAFSSYNISGDFYG